VLESLRCKLRASGVSAASRMERRLSEDVEMAGSLPVRVECEPARRQMLLLCGNVETGVVRGSGSESCPSRNADKPITKLLQGSCVVRGAVGRKQRLAVDDG
jgi:hypothetical protein